MSKNYSIIPGHSLDDSSIIKRIVALIDSMEFDKWIEVNEKIYSTKFFQQNRELYVIYLDPRGMIERLYIAHCDDIVNFIKERVNYEHGEGIDIAVCTKEITNAMICNHDGQIFLLKECL